MIKIVAPMTPRPAPRPDSKDKQRYSPKWYRKWKQDFGLFARLAMKGRPPLIGNLKLSALFYKLKPKDPQSKQYGDLDNLLKAVKDAMNGICYKDGNAKNERGDEIRVKFSVESYTQQPIIPGFISGYHTEDHGEYISFEAAKNYIRKLVDKLNADANLK